MQTADFNYEDFTTDKQREMDRGLLVKFEMRPKKDNAASMEAGRPIFKDVMYVDIRVPGKKNGAVCRPARQGDIDRFPEHFARFKNRMEEPVEGTPLTEWPPISRSVVEQLAFLNIKTVEQLADLNDTHCGQIMGGHTFKQKAKDFLSYTNKVKEATDTQELLRENEGLRASIAEMQENMKKLQARFDTEEESEDDEKPKTAAKKKKTTKAKNPLS